MRHTRWEPNEIELAAADGLFHRSGCRYGRNTLNLKIEAPCDDNFSDDELTMLPFFTFLTARPASRPTPPRWGSIRFRPLVCAYAP